MNTTPYTRVAGEPTLTIASVSITVGVGSRLKIEASATWIGSVAPGEGFLLTPNIGTSLQAFQSFDAGTGQDHRTCNYLAVTNPLPGGPETVDLFIAVTGDVGAQIDSNGTTCLCVTEILP